MLKFKRHKDSADGTLVLVMIALPMLIMMMTFVLNIAQTNADKNELNSLVQNAAQAGVSEVNGYGSLNKDSINKVVETVHLEETELTSDPIAGRFCEKDIVNSNGITIADNAPYVFYINLENHRGAEEAGNKTTPLKYTGPFNSSTKNDNRSLNVPASERFKVINIDAYINIRSYWAVPGTDACRTHHINISATTFGSSQDVDYDEDYNDEAVEDMNWHDREEWQRG